MLNRRICFVTGTRAEYGLLRRLMKMVMDDPLLQLQIIGTNMHLSAKHGNTFQEIEADGLIIDEKVDILKFNNSNLGMAQTTGLGVIEISEALSKLRPDLIVLLGDRYEILAAAVAALFLKIPVAHLHGGELTEGSMDDSIRHSITKMSHLHFTSTEEYRSRVIQLGENPDRVFNVGAIGIDNIKHLDLLTKDELERSLDFIFGKPTFLVTYHPATLDEISSEVAIACLLEALDKFPEAKIVFTKPNSDANSDIISQMIDNYALRRKDSCKVFTSLGYLRYLSALNFVDVVIGNSSSGILEVPSFGIHSVNIGNRQKGRIAAESVINCSANTDDIYTAIKSALTFNKNDKSIKVINPYDRENTAQEILNIIKTSNLDNLTRKEFYKLNNEKL